MPENLFDPTIHNDLEHLAGFKFRSKPLLEHVDALKRAPNERMRKFLAEHPDFRNETSGPMLAEYSGLAESTLKKLKAGTIADPRGSTYWLLWKAFGIDPRVLMGIPTEQPKQEAVDPAELSRLRRLVLEHSTKAGKAEATAEAMERLLAEKEESIKRRNQGIKKRNVIIIILAAVIFAVLAVDLLALWLA